MFNTKIKVMKHSFVSIATVLIAVLSFLPNVQAQPTIKMLDFDYSKRFLLNSFAIDSNQNGTIEDSEIFSSLDATFNVRFTYLTTGSYIDVELGGQMSEENSISFKGMMRDVDFGTINENGKIVGYFAVNKLGEQLFSIVVDSTGGNNLMIYNLTIFSAVQ